MFTAGDGDFVVKAIYDRDRDGELLHSKSGKKMIKVQLVVSDAAGFSQDVFDYFLDEYPKKKEAFIEAISWPDPYTPLDRKLINSRGRCVTEFREYNGKEYLNITRYKKPKKSVEPNPPPLEEPVPMVDDEIPF